MTHREAPIEEEVALDWRITILCWLAVITWLTLAALDVGGWIDQPWWAIAAPLWGPLVLGTLVEAAMRLRRWTNMEQDDWTIYEDDQ